MKGEGAMWSGKASVADYRGTSGYVCTTEFMTELLLVGSSVELVEMI